MRKGFTLIELLVVVLIIAILAAIALPQYQIAVEKSRSREAVMTLKAVRNAEEAYYLTAGRYTNDPGLLDIDYSCPAGFTCDLFGSEAANDGYIIAKRNAASGYNYSIIFRFAKSVAYPALTNRAYCASANAKEERICTAICTGPVLTGYVDASKRCYL